MFGAQVKSTLVQQCGSYLGNDFDGESDSITCGMVVSIPQATLENLFGYEKGGYLYRMCRGDQDEKVQSRTEAKSLSSAKTFFKNRCLTNLTDVSIIYNLTI